MKGSLIIVGFFVLGALCGVYHLIPYDFTQSKLSFYALCALMFSVGVSVGNDPQTLRNFRSLNPRLIFLPVMTILGTLAGCAVVSLFLSHRSVTDCMAGGAYPVSLLQNIKVRSWEPLHYYPISHVRLSLCFLPRC